MANTTVFVSTDIAIQGAGLVSGGSVPTVKKGVELLLLNNLYVVGGPETAGRGQSDVSVLLRQGLDFLAKSPHETLGVPVGCRTPEIRKAYKKHALKYHPDKNPLTTPLFQLMNAAHDKLTDPAQRQKEERTAAAKNPKPKPPPPAAAPTPTPAPTAANRAAPQQQPSANAGPANGHAHANQQQSNPNHPKQTYDPKTNKWSGEAEWGKYAQGPGDSAASAKAAEAARRKQYYDEVLREQFKKAESDRKAKEYAAMRDAANRARSGANAPPNNYNAYGSAPSSAGGQAPSSSSGSRNTNNVPPKQPEPASINPNSYYSNPYSRKPYPHQKDDASTGSTSARQNETASGNATNPNHYTRPPVQPSDASGGAYAGRANGYKATSDGKVHPQNVPAYGKIPTRDAPADAPGGIYSSQPNTARKNSAAAEGAAAARPTPTPTPVPGAVPAGSGIPPSGRHTTTAGSGLGSDGHNASSSNLRGGKANASRVPRPYGMRCLFVGSNVAELEWVTSKYHRNTLLVELSWRIKDKDTDLNASFRQPWESASKLISSGKCRKKNLVAGAQYEFRVRAVEELSGGLLGYRSDWSDSLLIQLLPDKTTNSTNNGPTMPPSPSTRGLPTKSFFNKVPSDKDLGKEKDKTASAQAAQPTQPAQSKPHTYERFSTKPVEPKINIYDHLNNNATNTTYAPHADGEGRRSAEGKASSVPSKTNAEKSGHLASKSSDPKLPSQAGVKPSAPVGAESPLHEMSKINLDNVKRYPTTLTGSGRQVWGDADAAEAVRDKNNAAKNAKSDNTNKNNKSQGVASNGKSMNKDSGSVSDLEVDEEVDDKDSVGTAEVEDEVNTVGVDEDSSSVYTTSKGATKAKQQASKAPVEMQKSMHNSSSHRTSGNLPGANASGHMKKSSSTTNNAVPSSANGKKRSNKEKGEFADFTIEVEEDGSDDEDEISSEEEDDPDDFEMEYEQVYTLIAPAAKVKAKKTASSANLVYAHPVRAEPIIKSTIIGYLNIGTDVVACADAGNWLKVRIHKQPTRKNSKQFENEAEWGWSVRADKTHEYLKPSLSREAIYTSHGEHSTHLPPLYHPSKSRNESPAPTARHANTFQSPDSTANSNSSGLFTPATPVMGKSASNLHNPLGNRSMRAMPKNPQHNTTPADVGRRGSIKEKDVQTWMELFDPEGHTYYYNELTNESKWEPPEWVEEKDPATGAK